MRAFILASVLAVAGCYGAGYTASVSNVGYGPDLVYVAPGVQVIADYDEPIFFMDGFYWRFYGDTWYRSTYYTGGWAYAAPPAPLLRIDHPRGYVHYRPNGWTPRHDRGPVVRDHRDRGPVIRDHREERPRYEPRPAPRQPPPRHEEPRRAPPPPPPARDHRDHRK
jgi:hypothetical protein